tara:strand:- start:414 stop:1766 length:1353 start_codon:yes stop_codon:yes gene_type:complete
MATRFVQNYINQMLTEQTEEEERRGAAAGTVAAGSAGAGIAADREADEISKDRDVKRAAKDKATKKASSAADELNDAILKSRFGSLDAAMKHDLVPGTDRYRIRRATDFPPYSPEAFMQRDIMGRGDARLYTKPQFDAMQSVYKDFQKSTPLDPKTGGRITGKSYGYEEGSRLDRTGRQQRGFDDKTSTSRDFDRWRQNRGTVRNIVEPETNRGIQLDIFDRYEDAVIKAPDTPDVTAARVAARKADEAAKYATKAASVSARRAADTGKVMRALGPVGAGLSIPFNFMQGMEYGKALVDTGDRTSKLEKEAGLQGREVKPSPFSPYNKDSLGTKVTDAASAAWQGTKQNVKDIGKDYSTTDAILDVATLGNWSGVRALGRQFGVMDDALMKDRVTDLDHTTRTASPDGPVTRAERQALVTQRTGDVAQRQARAQSRRRNAPELERKAMGY